MSIASIKFDNQAVLAELSRERLEKMARAGKAVNECQRVLDKASSNIVGQCLAHQGTFYEFDHYPSGDVYDGETHSQYYYHSHRPEGGEHGHFHTFLRAKGMPKGLKQIDYKGEATVPSGNDALAHLIAIAMNKPGQPISLFTVNRWVTDESFYTAQDTIAMLDSFKMDHTFPCLAVNQWITGLVGLFRPQIEALLLERDKTLKNWAALHMGIDIYEDRDLEVTSFLPINIGDQIAAVSQALETRQDNAPIKKSA
ncbi:hypothetical protein MNBD_ALPHA08-1219 [hydrothermal vent metagenome]|uniref:DUF6969 domain-containing protein n=1 Tax=hydrothermal vent metagenome TaxID=652676 RepID=A0A3B0T212_9ZZZZ